MKESIIEAIEKGKARGYSKTEEEVGILYLYEYAIKKKGHKYVAYYFKVENDKMDQFEDYSTEELKEYDKLEDAFLFIKEHNGDINLFTGFKGNSVL
jgi:hypothetical protein